VFLKGFGTNLNSSTTYHPDSDGYTERINRIIKDMLRIYVMDKPSKWEDYLYLVEFYYKNGCEESLEMISLESLYGIKCSMRISWDKPVDRTIIGIELLKEMEEKMVNIRKNLKVVQDRNKIYAYKGRTNR
jgi:hypothetical protein